MYLYMAVHDFNRTDLYLVGRFRENLVQVLCIHVCIHNMEFQDLQIDRKLTYWFIAGDPCVSWVAFADTCVILTVTIETANSTANI